MNSLHDEQRMDGRSRPARAPPGGAYTFSLPTCLSLVDFRARRARRAPQRESLAGLGALFEALPMSTGRLRADVFGTTTERGPSSSDSGRID